MAKHYNIYLDDLDEQRLEHIKQFIKESPNMPDIKKDSQLLAFCVKSTYQGLLTARELQKKLDEMASEE